LSLIWPRYRADRVESHARSSRAMRKRSACETRFSLAIQAGKDARLAFHATSVGFYERPCAARKTWISCQRRAYGFMSRLALIVMPPETVTPVMREHVAAKRLCPSDSSWQLRIDEAAIKPVARTRPSLFHIGCAGGGLHGKSFVIVIEAVIGCTSTIHDRTCFLREEFEHVRHLGLEIARILLSLSFVKRIR